MAAAMPDPEARAMQILATYERDYGYDGTLPVPVEDIAGSTRPPAHRGSGRPTNCAGGAARPRPPFRAPAHRHDVDYIDASEARRSRGRRRFTIAHELGHWYLHAQTATAGSFQRFCRPADLSDESRQEGEANAFAAAILTLDLLVREQAIACRPQPAAARPPLRCLTAGVTPTAAHARPSTRLDALMLIAHLADTHLGHRHLHHLDGDGRNLREQDFYAAFNAAIDAIIELRPAAVVHAGDLFDSYHPSTQALTVVLDALARLRDAEIPFIAIAGNHSTPRQRNTEHVFSLLGRFGDHHLIWQEPRTDQARRALNTRRPPPTGRDPPRGADRRHAAADPDARYNVLLLHGGLEAAAQVGAGEPGSITLDPE